MILLTGVNGFVGKHLVRELSSRQLSVLGVGNSEPKPHPEIAALLKEYRRCDVTDAEAVKNLPLSNISAIINLAGLANVGASFDNPDLYMHVNKQVLSVLGSAYFGANPKGRIVAISTGAVYDSDQPIPLNELSRTIDKGSPYSMSKLAMEATAKEFQANHYDCIVVRPFNHIGPGQGPGFLIPDLATKLKAADTRKPIISAGNLKTVRDYTDVRDIARAYAELATSSSLQHNLYNVCSGLGQSGEQIVQALCSKLGVDFSKLTIDVDQSLVRPTDPAKIIGDSSRLQKDTGWTAGISLDQTVNDIVDSL